MPRYDNHLVIPRSKMTLLKTYFTREVVNHETSNAIVRTQMMPKFNLDLDPDEFAHIDAQITDVFVASFEHWIRRPVELKFIYKMEDLKFFYEENPPRGHVSQLQACVRDDALVFFNIRVRPYTYEIHSISARDIALGTKFQLGGLPPHPASWLPPTSRKGMLPIPRPPKRKR